MASGTVEHATLTAEQTRMVFTEIASCACTLADLLRGGMSGSPPSFGAELHAMSALADRIGALADAASGEQVVGGLFNWTLGPRFRDSGQSAPMRAEL